MTVSLASTPVLAQSSYEEPRLQIPIPTVKFSGVDLNDDGTKVTIPYIAEYISGLYAYLISIVGVLAAVMMIIGGFQYLAAGGDSGRVKAAKERITNAIAGTLLALGAYAMLKTISPSLTELKGLEISVVPAVKTDINEITEYADVPPASGGRAGNFAYCRTVDECRQKCDSGANPDEWGSGAGESGWGTIPDVPGLEGRGQQARQEAIEGLKKAGAAAHAQGYVIRVANAYRPFKQQFNAVCDMIKKGDTASIGHAVAFPGGSVHQQGYAVDVFLLSSSGEVLIKAADCSAQRAGATGKLDSPEKSKLLDQFMASGGGVRYANEIWHYEFGGPQKSCRCQAGACPAPPIDCKGNC